MFGGFEGRIRQFRVGRKGQIWPALNSLVAPRAGLPGFAAAPRTDLEVSERLEELKEVSGTTWRATAHG